MKKLLFCFLFCLGLSSSITVFADIDNFVVEVSCAQAHVVWDHQPTGVVIAIQSGIQIEVNGVEVHQATFASFAGDVTHIFAPSLDDKDFVVITVEASDGESSMWRGEVDCSKIIVTTNNHYTCNDGRTNINLCEPLAIYPVSTSDGIALAAYEIHPHTAEGDYAFEISAFQLANLPDVEETCTITASANGKAVAYVIPTENGGMLQINFFPDLDWKMFIYTYPTFPMVPIIETIPYLYNGEQLPIYPPCFAETD